MRLTAWEEERLLIFSAAELARRRRGRGTLLNHPETVAIVCDAMLEAARDGASYEEIERAGRTAVRPDHVMPGVRELVDEIRLEVVMGDGTRLVVLRDPLGGPADDPAPPLVADGPGSVAAGSSTRAAEAGLTAPDRERRELDVTSTSGRIIRVSSHYPFDRVNARLVFDRDMAAGFRLDIPAGDTVRWAPGETRRVRLVRYGGESGR